MAAVRLASTLTDGNRQATISLGGARPPAPVSRGDRGCPIAEQLRRFAGVGPVSPPPEVRVEEQDRQLQQQQLGMDEAVDRPFPPFRVAPSMRLQPSVIRRPMPRLVLLDHLEALGQGSDAQNDR